MQGAICEVMNLYVLSQVIIAIWLICLGVYVLKKNPKSSVNGLFALFVLSFTIPFIDDIWSQPPAPIATYLFWWRVDFILFVVPLTIFLHFTLIFPRWKRVLGRGERGRLWFIPDFVFEIQEKLLSKKRYILSLVYAPAIIFAVTFPFLEKYWLIETTDSGMFYTNTYSIPPHPYLYPFIIVFAIMGIYALSNLINSYIQSNSDTERKQVKLVFLGLLLAGIISCGSWMANLWTTPYTPYIWSAYPLSLMLPVSYAIVKYRMMVIPASEEAISSKPKYSLSRGIAYLIQEEKPSQSYEIFTDLVTHEVQGLLFTRTHPQQVRDKYGLIKTPIVWLGESSPAEGVPAIFDTEEMTYTIAKFVNESKNSIVFIDNIEYLINRYDFRKVLKTIYHLKEIIGKNNSRLLLSINEKTLEDKEVALLKKEMEILE
jgi:hypothetical protein